MTRKTASDVFGDTAQAGAESSGAVLGRPWNDADRGDRVRTQRDTARSAPIEDTEPERATATTVAAPAEATSNGPFGPEPRRWTANAPKKAAKKAPKATAPCQKKPGSARRKPGRQASPVQTMPRREVRIPMIVFHRQEAVSEATGLPPMEALWMLAHLGWRQWTRDEGQEVNP